MSPHMLVACFAPKLPRQMGDIVIHLVHVQQRKREELQYAAVLFMFDQALVLSYSQQAHLLCGCGMVLLVLMYL